MADLIKTQHFTKQYEKILKNINFYPEEAIDPFAGECDLFNYSPKTKWTFYDIEPKKENVIKNDSLLNPIDYTNKITEDNSEGVDPSKKYSITDNDGKVYYSASKTGTYKYVSDEGKEETI